jgi:hypothetical protein
MIFRRHRSSIRRLKTLAAILLITLTIGCMSESTFPPKVGSSSAENCFPASVFTEEDMRARVDCHPNEYKLEISKDTVVLFAFPDPIMDWVGPVFVIHIPSVSEAVLKTDGSILFEGYKTSSGQDAIEDVLNNQELLARILDRAREIEQNTQP